MGVGLYLKVCYILEYCLSESWSEENSLAENQGSRKKKKGPYIKQRKSKITFNKK